MSSATPAMNQPINMILLPLPVAPSPGQAMSPSLVVDGRTLPKKSQPGSQEEKEGYQRSEGTGYSWDSQPANPRAPCEGWVDWEDFRTRKRFGTRNQTTYEFSLCTSRANHKIFVARTPWMT